MSNHDEEVLGKAYDARLMRRLLGYLRPHKASVICALVGIIGHSILQLVQPYLTKLAIDRHITTGDMTGLEGIALLFLGVLVGSFLLEYAQMYTMQMTGQRIMFDLRMQIYRHFQRLDLRFHDRNPVGRMMTRVTTDVEALNDLFSSGVISIFGDVFTLVGVMVVMLLMDWRLALVAFAVLPMIAIVTHWFRRHARESYRRTRTLIARINAFLQENITGMSTVQLFGQETEQLNRFDGINKRHRGATVESIFYYGVFYSAIEIIGALATALIIWNGGAWTLEGTLTLGTLVAFLQYSQRFFRPISDLSEMFNLLQSAMASSERIFALLETPVGIESPVSFVSRSRETPRSITFDHVWFAYNDEDYVVRDLSFDVTSGESVGIVGATGAGKSTLINLLMRFYDVNRGRILIDGVDIRCIDLVELRGLFSCVLQDIYLFSGTIEENVRLGKESILDEDIKRSIVAVHAERFIDRLPNGLKEEVFERGENLSVGQKQLLSFARALAFSPRVLILDEATSSVDTETELLIRDALRVLMAGHTTIAIAHRLSTVQDVDKLLVLHKGELREVGSHQELLRRRGIYYKLYQLQQKGKGEIPFPRMEDSELNLRPREA